MKIIDKNGRLFGRISVIDVLVLLVAAVMAVALYIKNTQRDITSTSRGNDEIVFQVMVPGIRTYVADAVQVDDLLFENATDSGGALGRITDIEVLPGTKSADFDADGTVDPDAPVDGCVNLLLTVKGEGIRANGEYMLNRVYHLGVNQKRDFCTKYALIPGTVWDILS